MAELVAALSSPRSLAAGLRAGALEGVAEAAEQRAVQPQTPNPESIQIGLSTDRVAITADFSGADLTIFGSLENADPLVSRQGRYDVIVVLEGPAQAGRGAPQGPFAGHVDQHGIGNLRQRAGVLFGGDDAPAAGHHRYRTTTGNWLSAPTICISSRSIPRRNPRRSRISARRCANARPPAGLFSMRVGGVEFLSQSLFRASLPLSPNVPVGTHKARAFLFRTACSSRKIRRSCRS